MTIQSQQCQKSKPSWGRRILFASGTVETNEEATVHIGDSERYRDWESYAKRWAALTRGKRVSNHLSSKTGSHSKEVAVTNQKATPAQAGGDSMPDCWNRSRRVLSKTLLSPDEREATLRGKTNLKLFRFIQGGTKASRRASTMRCLTFREVPSTKLAE